MELSAETVLHARRMLAPLADERHHRVVRHGRRRHQPLVHSRAADDVAAGTRADLVDRRHDVGVLEALEFALVAGEELEVPPPHLGVHPRHVARVAAVAVDISAAQPYRQTSPDVFWQPLAVVAVEVVVDALVLLVDLWRVVRPRRERRPDRLVHRLVRRREARLSAGAVDEVRRARRVDKHLRTDGARAFQAVDNRRRDAPAVAHNTGQVGVEKLLHARLVEKVVVRDAHILDPRAHAVENRSVADRTAVVGLVALVVRQEPRRAALREAAHELVRDAAQILNTLVGIKEESRRIAVGPGAARVSVVLHENRPLACPRRGDRRADAARPRAHDADVVVAEHRHVLRNAHRASWGFGRNLGGARRRRCAARDGQHAAGPDEVSSLDVHVSSCSFVN